MTPQEEINALRTEVESLRNKVKELEQKITEMNDDHLAELEEQEWINHNIVPD